MAEDINTQNSTEEAKKDMAQIYGLKLSDIEEVKLPNGKQYLKFYNPEDRSVRMIENSATVGDLSDQFKNIQSRLAASQGENDRENARAIFDYQLKYKNIELQLIPVRELKNNRMAYKYLFDNLDLNEKKAVRALLENMDALELEYINVKNAIGINKNNEVKNSVYNPTTNKCDILTAEVQSYDSDKTVFNDDIESFDISNDEFDKAIETIDISSDIPTVNEEYEANGKPKAPSDIVVRGRAFNTNLIIQSYMYPEVIDREEMSAMDKFILRGIIAAIARKKQKRLNNANKVKVLTNNQNKQAAFVDSVLLALLLGFFSGLLMTLIYIALKAGI